MSEQLRLDLATFARRGGSCCRARLRPRSTRAATPRSRTPPAQGFRQAALQAGAGHSDMSTTQRYIDLAGVSFRAEAELAESRVLSVTVPDDTEENGAHGGRTTSSDSSATPA